NDAIEGASDHERPTDDELQERGDAVALLVAPVDEVTVDREDRVIPPPADRGAEEPDRREVEAAGRERLAVHGHGAADPAPSPARFSGGPDVLHDDDLVASYAAELSDEALEHVRFGDVLQHRHREAEIHRSVRQRECPAVGLAYLDDVLTVSEI